MHPRRLPPVYLTAVMLTELTREICQFQVMARKYKGLRG